VARASCSNRRSRSASSEKTDSYRNIAMKPRVPRTIYLSHAPAPSRETISYGPSLVPDVRPMRCASLQSAQHVGEDATIVGVLSATLTLADYGRVARDPGIIQKRRCKRLRTCSGLPVLVRWQPHPTQQVSVAGVGADVPETRVSAEEDQPTSALLISHFEELKRLRFLAHNATGLS